MGNPMEEESADKENFNPMLKTYSPIKLSKQQRYATLRRIVERMNGRDRNQARADNHGHEHEQIGGHNADHISDGATIGTADSASENTTGQPVESGRKNGEYKRLLFRDESEWKYGLW